MRALLGFSLLAVWLTIEPSSLFAQGAQVFQGSVNTPKKVKFQPISTKNLVAPIPTFPGSQKLGPFGLLSLFGKNTPGYVKQPEITSSGGGLFGGGNIVKNVTPGFFNKSPESPSSAPRVQRNLDLSVFKPVKPYTPK